MSKFAYYEEVVSLLERKIEPLPPAELLEPPRPDLKADSVPYLRELLELHERTRDSHEFVKFVNAFATVWVMAAEMGGSSPEDLVSLMRQSIDGQSG